MLVSITVPLSVMVKTLTHNLTSQVRFPGNPIVNQAVIGRCPPLEVAKLKRRQTGDKRHIKMPGLLKRGGSKNMPLPYDLTGFRTSYTLKKHWYFNLTLFLNNLSLKINN